MEIPSTTDLSDDFGEDLTILPLELRDFGARQTFCGRAVTIKCFEDNSRIKEILATPGTGKVLVVDGGGSRRCALLGDMIATDAVANGWEGIVIFGCVRDSNVLKGLGIAIRALGATPRKSTRRGEGVRDIAIEIAGNRVNPGDLIIGDSDGVVVLTAQQAEGAFESQA